MVIEQRAIARTPSHLLILLAASLSLYLIANKCEAGVIKDLFHKVTNTGDKNDGIVRQSAPVCGSSLFSSINEAALSPEIILISNRQTERRRSGRQTFESSHSDDLALEYRFNVDNVTIHDLEQYGFNRDAPTTFIMHGFTSGYPLQGWMVGIVQAYTIEREDSGGATYGSQHGRESGPNYGSSSNNNYGVGTSSSNHGNGGSNHNNAYGDSSTSNINYGGGSTNSGQAQSGYSSNNNGGPSSGSGYPGGISGNYNNNNDHRDFHNGNHGGSSGNNHEGGTNYNSNNQNRPTNSNSNQGYGNTSSSRPKRYANSSIGEPEISERRRESSSNGYDRNPARGESNSNQRGRNNGASSASYSQNNGGYNSNSYTNQGHSSGSVADKFNGQKLKHNLFIINWNYAARGILYPRAVANIPIVATYATRFINNKLLGEAGIDASHIQLIGHSLGAHLAGYIGKNTKQKLGRIYGLDPAGPCFGAYSGFLYPKSQRLAPTDALEVITIQTNSALLGIDKPLGKYSVFVEGGEVQPGCKGGGVLKSLSTMTFDGGDFDTIACSHGRAPNLLTHSFERKREQDSCQMVAYACKDWHSFTKGQCGICIDDRGQTSGEINWRSRATPLDPVQCIRIGLEWQYSAGKAGGQSINGYSGGNGRPAQGYLEEDRNASRRPNQQQGVYSGRNRRAENSSSTDEVTERRFGRQDEQESGSGATSMFLRTSDTQPFCTFHYQVVLELNEPFKGSAPHMTLVLQDSKNQRDEKTTLTDDEFGHKFTDRMYTKLLTSVTKLGRIERATILFRDGLPSGSKIFKNLHVNYMSSNDAQLRQRLSSRLCPVEIDESRGKQSALDKTRFYFEPCGSSSSVSSGSQGARENQFESSSSSNHPNGGGTSHSTEYNSNNHGGSSQHSSSNRPNSNSNSGGRDHRRPQSSSNNFWA